MVRLGSVRQSRDLILGCCDLARITTLGPKLISVFVGSDYAVGNAYGCLLSRLVMMLNLPDWIKLAIGTNRESAAGSRGCSAPCAGVERRVAKDAVSLR